MPGSWSDKPGRAASAIDEQLQLDAWLTLSDAAEHGEDTGLLVSLTHIATVVAFPFTWDELLRDIELLEAAELELLDEVDADEMQAHKITLVATRLPVGLARQPGQRLHLVLGAPWKEALGAYQAGGGYTERGYWTAPATYKRGDLLLTILDRARVVMCLERARREAKGPDIYIEDDVDVFAVPIPVSALEGRLGRRIPRPPATLGDAFAEEVLRALADEVAEPTDWAAPEGRRASGSVRSRAASLQAVVLAAAHGRCAACERNFGALLGGAGVAGLEVHHLDALGESDQELVATTPDRLIAVCGGCHRVLHSSNKPSAEELPTPGGPPAPPAVSTRRFDCSMGCRPRQTCRHTVAWPGARSDPMHPRGYAPHVASSGATTPRADGTGRGN